MAPEFPSIPPGGPSPRPKPPGPAGPAGPSAGTPGPAPTAPAPAAPAPGPAAPAPADGAAIGAFGDPFATDEEGTEALLAAIAAPSAPEGPAPSDDQAVPEDDWRVGEARVLAFGHEPRRGSLWQVTGGEVVWADNGRRVTPDQADRMPAAQRAAYYRLRGLDPAPPRPGVPEIPHGSERAPEGRV